MTCEYPLVSYIHINDSGRPNRYGSVRRSAELSGSARFGGSAELAGSASRTTTEPNYYINHCFYLQKDAGTKIETKS